jgi:hypothetical protein
LVNYEKKEGREQKTFQNKVSQNENFLRLLEGKDYKPLLV